MIRTKKQYKITKKHAEEFREAYKNFDITSEENCNVHYNIRTAYADSLLNMYKELQEQVVEYETRKNIILT